MVGESGHQTESRPESAGVDGASGRGNFGGRPASWVAVSIIIVGFIVSGVAMVPRPTWWVFWLGGGIVVIGGIMATAGHIFDDWY
jgi:hypothetical protein